MVFKLKKSNISGEINIPGSKSHTIRALFIASLAKGKSVIRYPLKSADTLSAVSICRLFGADIEEKDDCLIVDGFGKIPRVPENVLDVGNSGTTLRFATATAGLVDGYTVLTGDEQIRKRPLKQLLSAMNNLGAEAISTRNNGIAPVVIKGKMSGGETDLDSVTSQYLSALLLTLPLIEKDSKINITRLNEVPYVDITLDWLRNQNIELVNNGYKSFEIFGGQSYKPFEKNIPGDFSSATFFMVLAAISGNKFILNNLDINDAQGDKKVLEILGSMGADISINDNSITIIGNKLKGIEIDMNSIPDALPAMAVAACFAEGQTKLYNVPQARLKETDRISVMCSELKKMGADIEELEDGLIIKKSQLKGAKVNGHFDHRVVMSLAIAGINIVGETSIDTAEAVDITFPEFNKILIDLGAKIEIVNG